MLDHWFLRRFLISPERTKAVRRQVSALLLIFVLLFGASACGSITGSLRGTQAPRRQFTWIVVASALTSLRTVPGGAVLATATFDNPKSFVIIGGRLPAFLARWKSSWALSFGGYTPLRNRLAAGPLPPGLRAVVLDQEAWPFTPAAEQKHPGRYAALAAALVHRKGLLLITTPAADLAKAAAKNHGSIWAAFLAAGIAGRVARSADVYEIQAQGLEGHVAAYRRFVAATAAQARRANPHIVILAGLSTNPNGQRVTAGALYQDVLATRGLVSGYWLNIPGQSAYCPRCGTPQPQVAARLLSRLRRTNE